MKNLTKDARGFIEGVSQYIQKEKGGKDVLPKVQLFFSKVTAQAKREQVARVASAVALTSEEKSRITSALIKLLGHDVECQYSIDADLLGGIKIQVADWVVDASLSTQLADIAHTIQ